MRARFPDATIIILSDVGNGEQAAVDAAMEEDCLLARPDMPDCLGTDFNDLHKEVGLDEVARQLALAVKPEPSEAVLIGEIIPEPYTDAETWPEPLLFGNIETPEINPELLPEPLSTFCSAVTDSCQTPPGMAVMMALSAVATCLQKRFEVAPFGEGYTEPVNVMTCTALDPATRKSAVVKAMTEPLTAWEMQQSDLLKVQVAKVQHERDMVIKSIDSIKSQASKVNSTDDDRRNALAEIRRLEDSMPPEVIIPRLWVDDVTVERLQNLMADNNERMALISAEGGIFEVLAGLYSGGKSNINVVLQSHAGEPV
jgi:putative DNA primase/helicase